MKLVFLLLIALGAALYFPESRAVVVDASEPVLNPVLRWSTQGEMRRIARDLETQSETGRGFPRDEEEFAEWLDDNYQGITSKTDPWGNSYALRLWPDSFGVVSPGPDGEQVTSDDVVVTGRIQEPRRRRR